MRLTDQQLSNQQLLLSGAFAGALAKTVIAPLDRIKINFQTDPLKRYTMKNAFSFGREIVKTGGVSSLWRGNLATMIRVMPYAAVNFTVFSRTKDFLTIHYHHEQPPGVIKFAAGAISGATATVFTYPLETLRARMAVDRTQVGYFAFVRGLVSENGLRCLYSGLFPTILGIVPYAGISFTTYETLKHHNKFLAGAFAGVLAQSLTYPLDVVRRRMQTRPGEYSGGVCLIFKRIFCEEGVRGLYKGLSMNWFKGPVAVSISLTTNDLIKQVLAS